MRKKSNIFDNEPNMNKLYSAHKMLNSNYPEALRQLKFLSDIGSIAIMLYVGQFYIRDSPIKDIGEAERWFMRAAKAGSLSAYYSLGRLYLESKRFEEARESFAFAASRDYMPAVHFLGRMYAGGRGIEPNLDVSEQLLERASAGGNVIARGTLGRLLIRKRASLLTTLRGFLLVARAWVELFIVGLAEGTSSDRLR